MRESLSNADYPSNFLKKNGEQDLYQKKEDVDRFYRTTTGGDLKSFRISVGESDLLLLAEKDIRSVAMPLLKKYRSQLKEYIHQYPKFAFALEPYPLDPQAPQIVQRMIDAAALAGVGPMAAVAGAIAAGIGEAMKTPDAAELIIENGGDLFLRSAKERIVAIYAGNSVLSGRFGLVIPPCSAGIGICTSAGTVGPSQSFGKADAAVVIAPDPATADAVATAAGNMVKAAADFEKTIAFVRSLPQISGVLLIKDDKLGLWGEIDLVKL